MRILVFGTFDQLHNGHRSFLDTVSKRGELWIVVGSDQSIKRLRGFPPRQHQRWRKKTVERAYPRARVALGDLLQLDRLTARVHPDVVLLGQEQQLPRGISSEDLSCFVGRVPEGQNLASRAIVWQPLLT
jgi:cytidyltransferase-like protein